MARAIERTATLPSPAALLAPLGLAGTAAVWAGKLVVGRALDVVLMVLVGAALVGLALIALPLATLGPDADR